MCYISLREGILGKIHKPLFQDLNMNQPKRISNVVATQEEVLWISTKIHLKWRPILPAGKQLDFLHPYVSYFWSQKSHTFVVGTSDSCMFCSMFLMFVQDCFFFDMLFTYYYIPTCLSKDYFKSKIFSVSSALTTSFHFSTRHFISLLHNPSWTLEAVVRIKRKSASFWMMINPCKNGGNNS